MLKYSNDMIKRFLREEDWWIHYSNKTEARTILLWLQHHGVLVSDYAVKLELSKAITTKILKSELFCCETTIPTMHNEICLDYRSVSTLVVEDVDLPKTETERKIEDLEQCKQKTEFAFNYKIDELKKQILELEDSRNESVQIIERKLVDLQGY